MKYWIIIDSWNLMETFVTESLSPYTFYEKRNFGNDLTRFISKDGESYTDLVLFIDEPESKLAIEVDDTILDLSLLSPCKNKGERKVSSYYYPRTIYFQEGHVRFRFESQEAINAFIAESKIIIEVKAIDKYKSSFFVKTASKLSKASSAKNNNISFDEDRYVAIDDYFNSLKGCIIAFLCGESSKTDPQEQGIILSLKELKNNVAGLNTAIMIDGATMPNMTPSLMSIAKVQSVLRKAGDKHTEILPVLRNILNEINSSAMLRYKEVVESKSYDYQRRLEKEKTEYEKRAREIESENNILDLRYRLEDIKAQEKEKGKLEGKTRSYFKKGTPEYEEKQEIKKQLKDFEDYNLEYRDIQLKLKDIEYKLAADGTTKYDSVLSSLFIRFSDNVNDLVKAMQAGASTGSDITDLGIFSIHAHSFKLQMDNVSHAELEYYNLLVNYLLDHPNGKQSTVADMTILEIISATGTAFKNNAESTSPEGKLILDTLRQFWKYKHMQTDSFSVPQELHLMQAVMSFLIKPRGFDQIERYMLNRGYSMKEYAYLLLGAIIGFAGLPKTLTVKLYSADEEGNQVKIDQYLQRVYKQLTQDYAG